MKKKTMTKIESRVLASIFKNIPIELWREVARFKTKGKREYKVDIHGRKPLPGKQYGWGGALKLGDCQSVDVYVRPTDESYFARLRSENRELSLTGDIIYAQKEKIAEQLRCCQEDSRELSLYNIDLLKENQELRELLKLLDRRQGGERRSRKAY